MKQRHPAVSEWCNQDQMSFCALLTRGAFSQRFISTARVCSGIQTRDFALLSPLFVSVCFHFDASS